MADTLTNIQTDVRFYANESDINLTTGINLRISNAMYRAMGTPGYRHRGVKIGRRWKEFTREDTSLTMVASQEQYTWPASPVFNEPFFIEGLDVNASNAPYIILPAPNMTTWSYFDDKNDARPLYSRLIDVSGTVKLALRPKPDQADPIRITGLIEPTAFVDGTTKTAFLNANMDLALAKLIASEFRRKRGEPERADELLGEVFSMLPVYDTAPILRPGGFIQPWVV